MVYSNTAVYGGEMSIMVNLVTLTYFHVFEALNDAFETAFFSGLHFYTISQKQTACRAMQLRFFKVEILLINAFKGEDAAAVG